LTIRRNACADGAPGGNVFAIPPEPVMTYLQLAYLHLATIVPAFFLGTYLMFSRKGATWHRRLGKLYMVLMVVTAFITLWMPAVVGPRFLQHFGFIHLFSLLTLWTVPAALAAARRHDVKAHRASMIGLYVGGLLIAGGFTFAPGRLMHQWFVA
jgi:uncharacterized membrane protein